LIDFDVFSVFYRNSGLLILCTAGPFMLPQPLQSQFGVPARDNQCASITPSPLTG
tara:strand:+ start:152 stop:316 length:165 start_codon:yes stop_codon:yes gene_type:complete